MNQGRNLQDHHDPAVKVQAKPIFNCREKVISLHILAGETLKEHVSKVPAFLVCISGVAEYLETGKRRRLQAGDYVLIEPDIKHQVTAETEAQLLLVK